MGKYRESREFYCIFILEKFNLRHLCDKLWSVLTKRNIVEGKISRYIFVYRNFRKSKTGKSYFPLHFYLNYCEQRNSQTAILLRFERISLYDFRISRVLRINLEKWLKFRLASELTHSTGSRLASWLSNLIVPRLSRSFALSPSSRGTYLRFTSPLIRLPTLDTNWKCALRKSW